MQPLAVFLVFLFASFSWPLHVFEYIYRYTSFTEPHPLLRCPGTLTVGVDAMVAWCRLDLIICLGRFGGRVQCDLAFCAGIASERN